MKIQHTFYLLCLCFWFLGCGGGKTSSPEYLFGPVWELEYLSDAEQGFKALFPDITPEITFERESGNVVGNSGCNGYQAPYELDGDKMEIGEPGPSTLMFCGEGENLFRSRLREVDRWLITEDGMLELSAGGKLLMRFRRVLR